MKPFTKLTLLLLVACMPLFSSCGIMGSLSKYQPALDAKMATINGKYQKSNTGIFVQEVIEVNGTKDDLYVKLLEFLTRTYNDANEVIQVKEKEEGLIVCKGCHRFNVNDFLLGSAIEETAWHIYKAEVKDGKVRVTITLDEMDYYCAPTQYTSTQRGSYSILECPPYTTFKDTNLNVRRGYVFYYAVSNIVALMEATKDALSESPAYQVDNNW